uniref:Uncharacterized protein n=1 Tax=Arundo donax TaxID=35708 RepID=A0A0A9GUB1_ARUDO
MAEQREQRCQHQDKTSRPATATGKAKKANSIS